MRNLKTTIKSFASAVGRLSVVSAIVDRPSVHGLIEKIPGSHILYGNGWDRLHPFDRRYGTDTSGYVPAEELLANESFRDHAFPYAGSQPSVLRLALAALPPVDSCTFLDLGCGKGRALLVASEFPFRDICGVELSPPLAEIARRNAAIIAQRYPQRTAVRLAVGDASTFPLPAGDLVLFLYNPFGAELIAKVVAGVEAALAAEHRSVYIAYYNPVFGHCFDASPLLRRRFARVLPYAAEELGYGPDKDDALVIWQGGAAPSPIAPADARIVVTSSGTRALLAASQPAAS
ncbi:methyltransferase domain-containing protein [Paraburkholderia sediminicola]|uniref:class I SAM-dependent methyltransferase n=1 Tax=Paraburkholderia sediminicola TaxID=458836 RepID=UPI0038B827C3